MQRGFAQHAANGASLCGDCAEAFTDGSGRYISVLSDGMGTGGCGDVLTGTIAALLAQGMSTWDAARAGAYYHGRAGEAAQARLGARGVTAWDVCEALRIE